MLARAAELVNTFYHVTKNEYSKSFIIFSKIQPLCKNWAALHAELNMYYLKAINYLLSDHEIQR